MSLKKFAKKIFIVLKMRNLSIIFITSKRFMQYLINWSQNDRFAHISIYFYPISNRFQSIPRCKRTLSRKKVTKKSVKPLRRRIKRYRNDQTYSQVYAVDTRRDTFGIHSYLNRPNPRLGLFFPMPTEIVTLL